MKSRRIEGKSEERWNLACTVVSSFICAAKESVTIRFPRKNVFLFQPPTRSDCEIEKTKKLKV
jgi:hypothetical protein